MNNTAPHNATSPGRRAWEHFQDYRTHFPTLGLSVDISLMHFDETFLLAMEPRMRKAFADMQALEAGAIANPDEQRMVGHYWLRKPALAPTPEIQAAIRGTLLEIKAFAAAVHGGKIQGATGRFKNVLLIGIGGSALGPQFVAHALGHPDTDKMRMLFFDNTDPDGMERILAMIAKELGQTLCIVISKSGGTKETANGMKEAKAAYGRAGLRFNQHAVAVTQKGSLLDKQAELEDWIRRFPMWDWVGGRTSELSAVGLLPAALQGIDIHSIIAGARACDEATRSPNVRENPSALLSLMWHAAGNGKGEKNMVVVPYKDRLEWLTRYIQQLVMESLGKGRDDSGEEVEQGVSVFGNKGSTDQHSYIQQLREGLDDFFLTFVQVLNDGRGPALNVEDGITSGDYLHSFLFGTKRAVSEMNRDVMTLTIETVSPFSIGVLIALFERAVGFYAALVNINAYHQPGVEAGKKAAANALQLQLRVLNFLKKARGMVYTVEAIAAGVEAADKMPAIHEICEHLSQNPPSGIQRIPSHTGSLFFRAV